jgi:hypothetical protein
LELSCEKNSQIISKAKVDYVGTLCTRGVGGRLHSAPHGPRLLRNSAGENRNDQSHSPFLHVQIDANNDGFISHVIVLVFVAEFTHYTVLAIS